MGWTVYGREYETAELTNTDIFQPIKPTDNVLLRAVRCYLISIGDPTFTSIHCEIYSDKIISSFHTPQTLIATSDSRLKEDVFNDIHGIRETWFEFDDVPLNGDTWYNFVLNAVGYAPVLNTSFLAWKRAWPDPVYRNGFTPTTSNLLQSPHDITLYGAYF